MRVVGVLDDRVRRRGCGRIEDGSEAGDQLGGAEVTNDLSPMRGCSRTTWQFLRRDEMGQVVALFMYT